MGSCSISYQHFESHLVNSKTIYKIISIIRAQVHGILTYIYMRFKKILKPCRRVFHFYNPLPCVVMLDLLSNNPEFSSLHYITTHGRCRFGLLRFGGLLKRRVWGPILKVRQLHYTILGQTFVTRISQHS